MHNAISTTIKREYFEQIAAKQKPVEYREDTPYWRKRIEGKMIHRIVLICGPDMITCVVVSWSKIETPAELCTVIRTPQCFAIHLDLSSVRVSRKKSDGSDE